MLQPAYYTRGLALVLTLFPAEELKTEHSNPGEAFQVQNRGKNHFPQPAGYTAISTSQYSASDLDSAGIGP